MAHKGTVGRAVVGAQDLRRGRQRAAAGGDGTVYFADGCRFSITTIRRDRRSRHAKVGPPWATWATSMPTFLHLTDARRS